MKCIHCEGETVVAETVATKTKVIRIRRCKNCRERYFTEEKAITIDTALRSTYWKIRRGEISAEDI